MSKPQRITNNVLLLEALEREAERSLRADFSDNAHKRSQLVLRRKIRDLDNELDEIAAAYRKARDQRDEKQNKIEQQKKLILKLRHDKSHLRTQINALFDEDVIGEDTHQLQDTGNSEPLGIPGTLPVQHSTAQALDTKYLPLLLPPRLVSTASIESFDARPDQPYSQSKESQRPSSGSIDLRSGDKHPLQDSTDDGSIKLTESMISRKRRRSSSPSDFSITEEAMQAKRKVSAREKCRAQSTVSAIKRDVSKMFGRSES